MLAREPRPRIAKKGSMLSETATSPKSEVDVETIKARTKK